jgi:hypothetical protein
VRKYVLIYLPLILVVASLFFRAQSDDLPTERNDHHLDRKTSNEGMKQGRENMAINDLAEEMGSGPMWSASKEGEGDGAFPFWHDARVVPKKRSVDWGEGVNKEMFNQ